MPTLRILTNLAIPEARRAEILAHASATVAAMLGKPESYVMVILEDGRDLIFGGSKDPAAYLELKSLGLAGDGDARLLRDPVRSPSGDLGHPAGARLYRIRRPTPPSLRLGRRDLLKPPLV